MGEGPRAFIPPPITMATQGQRHGKSSKSGLASYCKQDETGITEVSFPRLQSSFLAEFTFQLYPDSQSHIHSSIRLFCLILSDCITKSSKLEAENIFLSLHLANNFHDILLFNRYFTLIYTLKNPNDSFSKPVVLLVSCPFI